MKQLNNGYANQDVSPAIVRIRVVFYGGNYERILIFKGLIDITKFTAGLFRKRSFLQIETQSEARFRYHFI